MPNLPLVPPVQPPPPIPGAPAVFLGYQEGQPGDRRLELWNLTAPLGPHPTHSTVTRDTIERLLTPDT